MKDEGADAPAWERRHPAGGPRASCPHPLRLRGELLFLPKALLVALFLLSCSEGVRRSGLPPGAQAVLEQSIADIDQGRYQKLYDEAADEWRKDTTPEQSQATFASLREKLGPARIRDLQTAREEQTATGPIAGHSLVVVYQTSFERGEGMETFTLIERNGQWRLARYFVTSMALR